MGRIATLIHEAVDLSTPLTRKIAQFSRLLLQVILGLAALVFLVGILRGESAADMFMAAVALAVGAIPEGLPAAVTITLAIGVARMARRHAIIRKMPAVETLGSTTVICSDKTGTLTENQMTVSRIWAGARMWEVTGGGYEPNGEIQSHDRKSVGQSCPALDETLLAGLLCNDSQLVRKDGRLVVEGDPTEAALIVAARKSGLDPRDAGSRLPRVEVIPFESEHMYMAAQLLFTYAPFMNKLFHSAPISGLAWSKIVGIGLVVFVAVELKKWLDTRRRTGRSAKIAG